MQPLSPPSGFTLSADGPVPLRVKGGRRPLTLQMNGISLPSAPASRSASWLPDGPGFYTLSMQDAAGVVVREQVRVE